MKTFVREPTLSVAVRMSKANYHPNAYLSRIRNVKRGLRARTRVLVVLDKNSADAKAIGKEAELHYSVVIHHLNLLRAEGIVEQKGTKPHVWAVTGMGQKRLVEVG
jgi:predicted transcriptional regulator